MSSTRQPQPGLRAVALALAPVIYLLLAPASAFGQIPAGPAAEEAAGTSQPLSLEERRSRARALQAEIRGEIAALDESPVATATPAGSDFATQKRTVLERLESLAGNQLVLLDTRTTLERSLAEAEQRLAGGPATVVEDDPPFSLESYDAIAAVVAREVRALQAARRARRDAARNLDAARGELERRQSERRLAVDAIELATSETEEAQRRRAAELATLASRVAELRRQVALLRFGNAELHQTVAEKEEAFARDVLTLLKSGLEISSAGLEAVLSPLREREAALRRQLEASRIETRAVEDGLDRLQRRLETVAEKSSAQLVDLDARSTALQVLRQRALVLEDQLGREELKRRQWEQRARILSGEAGLGEARSWLVEVRGVARDLAGSRSSVEARIADTRKELEIAVAVGSGRIEAPDAFPRNWKERERQLRRLEELYQGELGSITELESFVARVLIDLEGRLSVLSFAEQMDRVAENAEGIWNTELTSVDDQPITVGKVVGALLLFVMGFLVSRLLSRMAGHLFSRRRHIDSGAAVAAQGLTFYLLLVVFFLIALDMVNIPLTAFTIAGGALALGVGLGAQNIINNFISGLILLVERPIKVGDICEVDATRGMVEHIGPRSTRVRTFDNIHIIVPNSAFLEKNVINWTLSDNIVRASVDVGVVYGSSTEDVVRVIEEVLEEIDDVLDSPKPQVLFMEFGDNALQFRAYFWIRVSEMLSRIRIASDVRFGIDRVFREAGLTIAFPQRDVHLDATEPIEVRMLPADPENANRPRE